MSLASLTRFVDSAKQSSRKVKTVAILAGVFGFSMLATNAGSIPTAHASSFRYSRGYSVQSGWLCYGWSNGAYHCTQHWRRSGSRLVSDNPGWVPNSGGATTSYAHSSSSSGRSYSSGYHPRGASTYPWGQCTWYAWSRDTQLYGMGMPYQWVGRASARGFRVGGTPVAGATVVFAGGVQGADSVGHVAHVERVYGNGTFLVSEMNYYGFGGGFGRVSYRVAHTGWGVSFIY